MVASEKRVDIIEWVCKWSKIRKKIPHKSELKLDDSKLGLGQVGLRVCLELRQ